MKVRLSLAIITVYALASIAAGITLAELTLHLPKNNLPHEQAHRIRIEKQFNATVQDVMMKAADGSPLSAWFVQPPNPNGMSVVLLHGIAGNRIDTSGYGDIFLERGYSVLMPDSREHGQSGGAIATYGVLERDDVRRWVAWARERAPGCTYLFGESMGAAIGLEATAVAPQLCAVAVESPYATFRQEGYERLGWQTHLGEMFWRTLGRPAIEAAIAYTRLRYDINLVQAAPDSAVKESQVPSLLIAGTADTNIPMHNAQQIQRDCQNHCALWIVRGADHGGASRIQPVEFRRRVLGWFQSHKTPGANTTAE